MEPIAVAVFDPKPLPSTSKFVCVNQGTIMEVGFGPERAKPVNTCDCVRCDSYPGVSN